MSIRLQKLMTTLVEQTIYIACTCKCLIIAIGIQFCQFATIILKLNVRWIAYDNIKTIACVEACYASIREKRTVTLDEILKR